MAAGTKRALDDASGTPKAKKSKLDNNRTKRKIDIEKPSQPPPTLVAEDVDFPRGGGTSFTALEVKALRAEAAMEADEELFKVRAILLKCAYSNSIFDDSFRRRLLPKLKDEDQMVKARRLERLVGRRQFALSISTTKCVFYIFALNQAHICYSELPLV